jgi:hypothetical protein
MGVAVAVGCAVDHGPDQDLWVFAERVGAAGEDQQQRVDQLLHKGVVPNAASSKQLYLVWAGLPEAERDIFAALLANPSSKKPSVDRRHILLAAGLSVPAEVVERVLAGGPVDASLVAGHEVLADVLAQRLWSGHVDVLLALVDREASVLLELLDRPMGGEERRRLDVLATGAHIQAATLALDARRRVDARRYLALARDIADDSGDPALQAQALAASVLPRMPWMSTDGRVVDPRHASQVLAGALDRIHGTDGPTQAWVHRWMAVVLAAKRDERGFRFHAEQADRALDKTLPTSLRVFWTVMPSLRGARQVRPRREA